MSRCDFYAVSVGPFEPALGDCRDGDTRGVGERVLVVEKIAGGLEIVGTWDIDGEAAVEESKEVFRDGGDPARALDFVGRSETQEPSVDVA